MIMVFEIEIFLGQERLDPETVISDVSEFVQPAVFYQEDPDNFGLDSSSKGTVFLLRYREFNFAICTRHQFANKNAPDDHPDQFSLLLGTKDRGFSPDGAQFVAREGSGSLSDIFVASYQDIRDGVDVSGHFGAFELHQNDQNTPISMFFTVGLPTDQRTVETNWNGKTFSNEPEYKLAFSSLYLEPVPNEPMDEEHRMAFGLAGRSKGWPMEPDGLSGAPVFGLLQTEKAKFSVVLVGFITHGRELCKVTEDTPQRFLVYPVRYIQRVLDDISDASA